VESKNLENIWRGFYWTAFFMTWFFIPFFQTFVKSGEFTVKGRFKKAVFENLLYYGILAIIGIIAMIYLWYKNTFTK
jgi:hypothetical protein